MGKFVDSIIAYRILKLLVVPFKETEAYKRGIIDDKGKELRKMRDLNTVQDRDAYTILHRLVYRIKRIIERVPIENKKLVSYAAALALIKEQLDKEEEYPDIELRFNTKINEALELEIEHVHNFLHEKKMFTFKQFTEEVPAMNTAVTPSGTSPQGDININTTIAVRKKKSSVYAPMLRRKKDGNSK
jgi:hypothetical protein